VVKVGSFSMARISPRPRMRHAFVVGRVAEIKFARHRDW
jgi:hypothetical protein